MPENIMKTLWDESDDLHDETMSTNSVLSDDYTSFPPQVFFFKK